MESSRSSGPLAYSAMGRGLATAVTATLVVVMIWAMCSVRDLAVAPPFEIPESPMTARAEGRVTFDFTAQNVLALTVIGLVAGTFGGMLGMGGGVLKMSFLLLFFGFHPGVSRFAALLSYFVVAVGASYRYLKARYVMMDVVKVLIPSSVAGIFLGAFIGHYLSRDMMTLMLGMFLLFVAVVMVRRILSRAQGELSEAGRLVDGGRPDTSVRTIALCGFPGGFLSAMLGISGGVITNPLQQVMARIPIKNSIANTLLGASVTVPIACIMILAMGVQSGQFDLLPPVLVALCLVPGSIAGSQLGPALTQRMSGSTAHALFGGLALFMGINMLFFS